MARLPQPGIWKRRSLAARLIIISGLLFVIGGTVLLYTMVEKVASNRRATLAETAQSEIQVLVPIIGEQAIVGDYASIEQTLSARTKHSDILRAEWKDNNGTILSAGNEFNPIEAPAWFMHWANIPALTATDNINIGGTSYGSVSLEISPAHTINFLWSTFKQQLFIIILSSATFFTIMGLFLWYELRPLKALAKGTKKFGEGDYSVRIKAASTPEINASIIAFNRMGGTIQALLASMQEKETYLRAVMDSVDDAIVIINERQVIESFNYATPRIFAYAAEQLPGRDIWSLLDDPSCSRQENSDSLECSVTRNLEKETTGRRSNGELFPIELRTKPMQSQEHRLFVVNIRDITKRKRTEAALALDRERLAAYQSAMEQELAIAHHVFQTITTENARQQAAIELWSRPMALFNGDLLLYEHSPSGQLHIMLCDFTGHGLGAAIGAIPVSDAFLSMSRKGYSLIEIAAAINHKLHRMLPTGHFCAACLISINQHENGIEIWNGGMPPVLIMAQERKILRRVGSSKLLLGIIPTSEFDTHTEVFSLHGVHSMFLYSDGLTEARSEHSIMLGQAGLERILQTAPYSGSWLEAAKSKIVQFIDSDSLGDDISLLHVKCDALFDSAPAALAAPASEIPATTELLPGSWRVELQISGDMIKKGNPLPLLMNWLIDLGFPKAQRSRIYTILSELINNAVEHGLLKLNSELKSAPEGFENYYAARHKLLEQLDHGMLLVQLSQKQQMNGKKKIHILVKDTGTGFDFGHIFSQLNGNDKTFGRGIPLVHSLSSKLHYTGRGNCVEVEYAE